MQTYDRGEIVEATETVGPLVRGHHYEVRESSNSLDRVVLLKFNDHRSLDYFAQKSSVRPTGTMATPPRDIREVIDEGPKVTREWDDGVFITVSSPILPTPAPTVPSGLPDGNPKTRFGVAKPSLALIPGTALVQMATAFRDGATKYGPANWREDPVTTSTYVNAALRHLVSYYDGEDVAADSGVHHLAHAAACLAILLDAEAQGTLNDDRPVAGKTAEMIREKTAPLAA